MGKTEISVLLKYVAADGRKHITVGKYSNVTKTVNSIFKRINSNVRDVR